MKEDGAVALDWDRIGTGDSEALLRPRDIYAGLASRPWPYLRHEQGEVLDKWFERRGERDVVIKQNTGGGKTAVGLLIAQSTLNEGIGKAVYLTPDNYLVKQVREEAARLNIATTDDPYEQAFLNAQAVLVTNYQKLLNGRSAFGVVGDGKEPLDLGVVVVDDAHAALARTEDQFRLRVPAGHEAYDKLLQLFAQDLHHQSANAWSALEDKDPTALAPNPVLGVGRQARRGAEDPAPAPHGAGLRVRLAAARGGAAPVHRDGNVGGGRDQALVPAD